MSAPMMSITALTTLFSPARPASLRIRLAQAGGQLRAAWAVALREAKSRRNVGRLDDRMLADIGISRAQAEFEAWRWR